MPARFPLPNNFSVLFRQICPLRTGHRQISLPAVHIQIAQVSYPGMSQPHNFFECSASNEQQCLSVTLCSWLQTAFVVD